MVQDGPGASWMSIPDKNEDTISDRRPGDENLGFAGELVSSDEGTAVAGVKPPGMAIGTIVAIAAVVISIIALIASKK